MKKIISIILILAMLLGLATTVSFATTSSFSDIKDEKTASAVEVLRLMGVIDGTGDGTYNPNGTLTRGEYAKLTIASMYSDADFTKYKNITIFPDVRASEWFAPYVNMAAKGLGIISGCPDGLFHPERTISVGEAVTLILRLIGITDDEVGGVWPYGHFEYAKNVGLLANISVTAPSQSITRGQAAILFVNAINVDAANKKTVFRLSGETVLISVNAGAKTLKTKDASYKMTKSISANSLIGKAGYVVMDKNGSALSFLPKSAVAYEYDQAIVIKSSGDKTALNALAGRTDYTIIKNGSVVTVDKVKNGDVAVYDKTNNAIVVCDTKVAVLYASCVGSPAEPVSITALDGNTFEVLPSAISTLSNYKPGAHMSLYLTAAGQVAAVGGTSLSNAVFVVTADGKANMVCGADVIEYGLDVPTQNYWGRAVELSYEYEDRLSWSILTDNSYGSLKISEKKLGSRKIADNALIFENGERTSLSELSITDVSYARLNSNGEIDLIVCYNSFGGNIVAGYAEYYYDQDTSSAALTFNGPNNFSGTTTAYDGDSTGYYIINYAQGKLLNPRKLNLIRSVEKSAFQSSKLVTVNSTTMSVYKNAGFYNKDTKAWTTYEEAMAYGRSFTLYGLEGTVYAVVYSY